MVIIRQGIAANEQAQNLHLERDQIGHRHLVGEGALNNSLILAQVMGKGNDFSTPYSRFLAVLLLGK